jgi:hypothetical protein
MSAVFENHNRNSDLSYVRQLRMREEGRMASMQLGATEPRNEVMKQTVLQEFEHFVNVSNAKRATEYENGIVISCRDGLLLEPASTVLTLEWSKDKVALCAVKPGDTTMGYGNQLSCQNPDLQCFGDAYGCLHLLLTKKIDTVAEWRKQFWPIVKDMITLVFRHSLFRFSMFCRYGSRNVFLHRPPVLDSFKNEVLEMVMIICSPGFPGITLKFYESERKPMVKIMSAAHFQSDDAIIGAMMQEISRQRPRDARKRDFIAEARQDKGWHVRIRFQYPADMEVILQAVQILKRYGSF